MSSPDTQKRAPLAAPDAQTWSIERILREARSGRLLIPIFQRNFRWDHNDIAKLFDSLYRGFPIGNLLVWATEPTASTSARFGTVEFERTDPRRGLVIIDGQQRVTSLVATLLAPADSDDSRFKLYFDLAASEFCHLRGQREAPASWLPMTEVTDTVRFLEWLQASNLPAPLVRQANEVVRAIRDYKVPVYEISGGPEQESVVREIFQRLNSTGKRLKETDIFNALHRKQGSAGLQTISGELRGAGFGVLDERWLMKAVAAVLGYDREKALTEHFSRVDADEQARILSRSSHAMRRTIGFLRSECRIPHWSLLPYRFPIGPLAAYFARFPDATPADEARLRLWLWRGAVSGEHKTNSRPMIKAALDFIRNARDAKEASEWLRDSTTLPTSIDVGGSHNRRSASTKMIGCALAVLEPRHLETGRPIDLEATLDGDEPFPELLVRSGVGTENRLLHPRFTKSPTANAHAMQAALAGAAPDVWASHLIPSDGAAALAQGDEAGFLTLRGRDLRDHVGAFLAALCEVPLRWAP